MNEANVPEQFIAPRTACPRCRARGKTWSGGDPKCAFPNGGRFTSDNWNCATANALRTLCGEDHAGKDQHSYSIRWNDDSWAALNVIGVEFERGGYKTLWLSWYKHRGRTDTVLLLSDDVQEPPDMADCEAILSHFEAQQPQ